MNFQLKNIFKSILGFFFKINPILRISIKNQLTIFVFHEVSDEPGEFTKKNGLTLSCSQFKQQAEWINKNFNAIDPKILNSGEELPKNACLITFDDGFLGAFNNAFPVLESLKMPFVMFLNMKPVIERKPMLSAYVLYLSENDKEFKTYLSDLDFEDEPHLHINPILLNKFIANNGSPNLNKIITFQGKLVDEDVLIQWDKSKYAYYANHFHDHWNAAALSRLELIDQFKKNYQALCKYKSSINFLAFTNGKPKTCFNQRDVDILQEQGIAKVFSSVHGVNKDVDSILLGRLATNGSDHSSNHFWYRIGMSFLKKT